MATITINFSHLEKAISDVNQASKKAKKYAESLDKDNFSLLTGITGGCNGYVESAYEGIRSKKTELSSLSSSFDSFATKLTNFESKVKEADNRVKNKISSYAKTFANAHNVKTNAVEDFWNWICDGVSSLLNNTEWGQWLNNALRKVGEWFGDRWDDLKEWYALEGGQFWVNIGLGLLAIAAAVFTIVTAGVGFLAIVAIVGAVIAIANAVVQIGANVTALIEQDQDPAWARRCGKISKLSNWFSASFPDSKILQFVGKTVDIVEGVCAIIGFADFATKTYSGITGKETMFQKYLGKNGVLDSYFVIDKGTDAEKALRQFNGLTGQWEKLDSSGKVMYGADGKVLTVDFGEAGSGFKYDFKTGMKNLFGKSEGLNGWQVIKGKVGTDVRVNINDIKTSFSEIKSTVSTFKNSGFKAGLKEIHNTHMEKHYGKIPSFGDAKTIKEKITVVKARSAVTWGNISEKAGSLKKTIVSDLGLDSFKKDGDKASKIGLLKTQSGREVHIGQQLHNVESSVTKIGKLLSGQWSELKKPIAQWNKFTSSVHSISEKIDLPNNGFNFTLPDLSVGGKTTRTENWNQVFHRSRVSVATGN